MENIILLPPTATTLIEQVCTGLVENKIPFTVGEEVVCGVKLLRIEHGNRPKHGETARTRKAFEA